MSNADDIMAALAGVSTPAKSRERIAALVAADAARLTKAIEGALGRRPGPDGWHWASVTDIDVEARFQVRDKYVAAGWEVTVDAFGIKLRPGGPRSTREGES